MEYETVIGLEVHVQLLTESKMFCSCAANYQTAPANSHVCPVCLGLPGTLPVINRQAVEHTIATGLALGCQIPEYSKFDRKNYPYPDLMKGYQISQFDLPIAIDGCLEITVADETKRVGVERVHLEEDAAKLQHVRENSGESYSLVDINRSGMPLMEIVSKPDMRSAEEARTYLMAVHSIVQYLGASTGNMQDGSLRCDVNVSIRPVGSTEFGTRTEVKNMNSFRSVFMAVNYEVERQRNILEDGGRVIQETRGWLDDRNVTMSQRSKEFAHDYRYFPEPDLPPLVINPGWVDEIRSRLPELAHQRRERLIEHYGIPAYDANLLTNSQEIANYYEQVANQKSSVGQSIQSFAKSASNWVLGDITRLLNLHGQRIQDMTVTAEYLAELIDLVDGDALSTTMAKTVLEEAFVSGDSPGKIVAEKGYAQINDASAVEAAVLQAIEANPKAVADFLDGKETAAKFLVGQVMRITKGQAKPDLVQQLVTTGLESARDTEH